MTKKIFSVITLFFLLFGLLQNKSFADKKEKKYFRVTAYYSPLPNQSHYIMGNYKKEIRMNGKGIRGASGKGVFSGMLAAPKNYPFGTKIKLKGLGIAEVADRGGAIVKAGERSFKNDRIDIWVGYGEEGLKRAMYWGNRVIEGEIVDKTSKVDLDIKKFIAPKWTIYKATKNPDYLKNGKVENKVYLTGKKETLPIKKFNKVVENNIFNQPIKNLNGVKKLQEKLIEMKLYSGKIDGEYLNIREIILNIQLKNKIISDKYEIGAGNFGPKTRKFLKENYKLFLKNKKFEEEKAKIKKQEEKLKKEKEKKAIIEAEKRISLIGNVKYGDVSIQVRQCQILLRELGYFNYKDTAIFGKKTRQSIINYQLDNKLISNENIYGAGMFGPITKKSIIKDLTKKSLEK